MKNTNRSLVITAICTLAGTIYAAHSVSVPTKLINIYNESGREVTVRSFPANTSADDTRAQAILPAKKGSKNSILINGTVSKGVVPFTNFVINGSRQELMIDTYKKPKLEIQKDLTIKIKYAKK